MIVGIIEGLQNNCGLENIEYHTTFNQWLLPRTQKIWDGLIYLWESNDSVEEKHEKLKDHAGGPRCRLGPSARSAGPARLRHAGRPGRGWQDQPGTNRSSSLVRRCRLG